MGRGSYTASDWECLAKSKRISDTSVVKDIFSTNSAVSNYVSSRIAMRESRDSEDSKKATPIIIGFDNTASMGFLAEEIAKRALNKAIIKVRERESIEDPQFLCASIGDCKSDRFPLQVSQFEADIRIIKQLFELYIEGGGGGNRGESYNLLWYFAARHTVSDCYEKRGKKGYLITIGDDACHPFLSKMEIKKVFQDDVDYNLSNEELIRELSEKYHIYHILIERPDIPYHEILASWQNLLPGRVSVIHSSEVKNLAELMVSIIEIASGKEKNNVLSQWNQQISEKIARSLALGAEKEINSNQTIIF